jgi:hypothetical protein
VALDASALSDRYDPGPALAAGLGLVTLATALAARFPSLVPVGLALLGAAYAIGLEGRGDVVDGGAVLVAPALLLVGELAFRSLEPRGIAPERSLVARDAGVLLALMGGSSVAAALLVGTTAVDVGGRAALVAAGVAAATATLALTARLARRSG